MSCLLVGEDNPYGADPRFALYYLPPHASGGRLQRLVLGLREETYEALPKVNLCSGPWSMPAARAAARGILTDVAARPRVIVMLGRKVADAFRYSAGTCTWQYAVPDAVLVSIPHPSGLNRAWNDKTLPERCRETLRQHCPPGPVGRVDRVTYGPRTPSQERDRLRIRRRRIDLKNQGRCVGCEGPHIGCTDYCPTCRVKRADDQRKRRGAKAG